MQRLTALSATMPNFTSSGGIEQLKPALNAFSLKRNAPTSAHAVDVGTEDKPAAQSLKPPLRFLHGHLRNLNLGN